MRDYDAIVLGCGGVGSATLWHLARRGVRVVGLDRYEPAHDRGSSHGRTRIIRKAYFEHPDYVPLVVRAWDQWRELETECGQLLLERTGLLEIGPPDGTVVPGVLASARQFDLAVEELSAAEIARRFPGFGVPPGSCGVYEPDAGCLRVENCVRAHLEGAVRDGAEYLPNTIANRWTVARGLVAVETNRGVYRAPRLVVTAGPWATNILGDIGVPLEVRRKHVYWLSPRDDTYAVARGAPTFLYELPEGVYYGFPQCDALGVKVARHSGGDVVADATAVDRHVDPADRADVLRFTSACLPGLSNRFSDHSVCMYTMTPDQHFLLDRHPRHPEVVFAAGLSGHGYKFAPVLGEALADLAMEGTTALPVSFLGRARF